MAKLITLPHVDGTHACALEVVPDVVGLQLAIVNVYFVGLPGAGDRGWVLIDAGLSYAAGRITRAAERRFGQGARPAAIVLTHGHFDHVGALSALAEQWDAPIYAHPLEMPYLTGRSSYPPPDHTVLGGLASLLAPLYPRGPIDLGSRVHPLPADGSVPGMAGWRWLHTPGHSPGHVSFFRDADRTLIAGDAFMTTRQESALALLTNERQVWRPPACCTTDWEAARRSVLDLAMLHPAVAAPGHGLPMAGGALEDQLTYLAVEFDRFVPRRGRYVVRPAIADERGVVSVPPPVAHSVSRALIALGATAAAGAVLFWLAWRRGALHKEQTARMVPALHSIDVRPARVSKAWEASDGPEHVAW